MQQITKFDHGYVMVRNADISTAMVHVPGEKYERLQVTIADQYSSLAGVRSSWNETATQTDDLLVRDRLQGGTYFVHEETGQIMSYKYREHNGFVHTDDNINALLNHVGTSPEFDRRKRGTGIMKLQDVHSTVEMNIPFLQQGGEFNSELSFSWDPFQSHVKAQFRLVRIICANGMVGLSDFMNCKIPLVNEWIEHLQIANKQIQNKVSGLLHSRVQDMSNQRASIRDCQRIVDSCVARLKSVDNYPIQHSQHLRDIISVCDPVIHLQNHYPESMFTDRRISEQSASHLTQYTLWNMLTELATHTIPVEDSTTLAVQKHANELFLPHAGIASVNSHQSKISTRFDDLDSAFSGTLLRC